MCEQGLRLFNQSKEMSKVKFIETVDLNFTLGNYIILVPCTKPSFSKPGNRSFVPVGGGIVAGGIYRFVKQIKL